MLAAGVVLATDMGGYFPHSWYPVAILALAALVVVAAADRRAFAGLPRVVVVAIGAFTAYTAWTYLSITWADDQGTAWDAANQTLMYLLAFLLGTSQPVSGEGAALAAGAWALAMTGIAVVVLLKLPDVLGGVPGRFRSGLEQPFGYSNANAAAWCIAIWPALLLSAAREMPWWLRGVFAAAVVVLADTALLSDSDAAVLAIALVLVVLLLAVPGRARMLLMLVPIAAAVGATAPHLLDLAHAAEDGPAGVADLGGAAAPALLAALAAGAVVALLALGERRRPLDASADVRRVVGVVAVGLAVGAAAVGVVAVGSPADEARDTWQEFKDTGTAAEAGKRDPASLGSARYDYYRVALDLFEEHPVAGIGAGNFGQDYLARGRVGESPSSPHSTELRALVQGGLVGAALLAVALAAALAAALANARRPGPGGAAAAGSALAFIYWLAHGSVDWLWEFPALAAPAFALLGLAAAVDRPAAALNSQAVGGAPPTRRVGLLAAPLAFAAAAALIFPWLAVREMRAAERAMPRDSAAALRHLDRAADLNPLSAQPDLMAGTFALQAGRIDRARTAFQRALERDPRSQYATLLLGAIASREGRRADALVLLRRALRLAPGDPPALTALEQARNGRVDLDALRRQIFDFSAQRVE